MCCGFLNLDLPQFMAIQRRLLLEQMELLNKCALGRKLLGGLRPTTVEEFRRQVPLTTYSDYCPELLEKREDFLPARPVAWAHTSGRSGEYPFKWIPMTESYSREMSRIMYGLGTIANCKGLNDLSNFPPPYPRLVYTVAPRPYISGTMAAMLEQQTPLNYLPSLEEAEKLSFEERVKLGFEQALSEGLDYFFGLSLVLVAVGNRFRESSGKVNIVPLLSRPRALLRLVKGLAKSKLAHRSILPRDLWSVKGIISSGLDSWVYRDKIKELWGRYPLDIYCCTEGSIIATQTWDYGAMSFIPTLNFLEFIPEKEHFKWQLDHNYQPKTVLLDEVEPDENYEVVLTNFHGGALTRYRVGDMIKITSLSNEKQGIKTPQMVFERRVDGLLDFFVVRLTEKTIWQAIEKTGIPYEDWTAYKEPGSSVLKVFIEPKNGINLNETDVALAIYKQIMESDSSEHRASLLDKEFIDAVDYFRVDATLLPRGAFANYLAQRQAEGADLAHLKPPHINPSDKVLALLTSKPEVRVKATVKTPAASEADSDKVKV